APSRGGTGILAGADPARAGARPRTAVALRLEPDPPAVGHASAARQSGRGARDGARLAPFTPDGCALVACPASASSLRRGLADTRRAVCAVREGTLAAHAAIA